MQTQDTSLARELDSRSGDWIRVRLLWRPADDRVVVAVTDARTSDAFELDVREGERPLDVFHHPYAYAAHRGIATERKFPAVVPSGVPRSS